MGTNGVSGSGNNYFKVSDFWKKPNLQGAKTENTSAAAPIKLTGLDTIKRENLELINPYNTADSAISGAREIASKTNDIMVQLGYPNYKVTPKTVASVSNGLKDVILPGLELAENGAVAARIANPNGPFAQLFT